MVPESHPALAELEAWALGWSADADLEDAEEHLRFCPRCQEQLATRSNLVKLGDKGRLRSFHITEDGPIFGATHCLVDGNWMARHWGRQLDGYRICDSTREANANLKQSFQEMFPEHSCTRLCIDY